MSDFGNGMGAAMRRQMTSEAVILILPRLLNWDNTATVI
jgi:hypothetical protein